MYRTIITSAAVAVAALAIVAGASAAVNSPVACLYAMPTSLIQAQVCGSAPYGTRSDRPARRASVSARPVRSVCEHVGAFFRRPARQRSSGGRS